MALAHNFDRNGAHISALCSNPFAFSPFSLTFKFRVGGIDANAVGVIPLGRHLSTCSYLSQRGSFLVRAAVNAGEQLPQSIGVRASRPYSFMTI